MGCTDQHAPSGEGCARPKRLPRRRARLRRWLREHDARASFTVLYITLALVLSMAISMFWLVAVVATHGVLEHWSLARKGVADHRLGRTLWHIKLDIVLVLAALWLGLFIDLVFGIVGLSAAARTGAQAGARFIAWQRAVRGVLLTADEAALAAKSALGRGGGRGERAARAVPEPPPWRARWSFGERLTVTVGIVLAALILLAPVLTDHGTAEVLAILGEDLHPWP